MLNFSNVDADVLHRIKAVLANFAVPNNTTLLQASKDLHILSQNASFLPSLFYILSKDDSTQMKQTASVVFRRKIVRMWKSIEPHTQQEIRSALLQQLAEERENIVKHSIMEIIGGISKQEFSCEKTWPNLMLFISNGIRSQSLKENECGAELLKIVCENCAEYLDGQYDDILLIIDEALCRNSSNDMSYYSVDAFNSLIPFLGDDHVKHVRPLVLKCVNVMKKLLEDGCETQATELIELFESLVETEVSFIAPFVKDLVLFILQVAGNEKMEDEIRARALSVLQCIIRMKKKAIMKHNLISTILNVICPILLSPLDDESENDEMGFIGESADNLTPLAASLHVIDDMALHFPPEKLFDKLMPFIQACASSDEDRCKRGLLLTLACLSEGISEYIKTKHLQSFLEIVCRGAMDSNSRVRNAALFALGQFSEHLQPDIGKFAPEIMPILFEVLNQVKDGTRGSGITKTYYALENFVENLESGILPYLEKLMEHLLVTLRATTEIHTKEVVISAIGAVAIAAKEDILPFLPEVLTQIQSCLSTINLSENEDNGELSVLHTQALDTLAVLVRNLGKSNLQLAEDSMKLSMELVGKETTDPDIRRAAYGLFAAVASVVGESMQPFMSVIVKRMIDTIQSNEGIVAHLNPNTSDGGKDFSFLDDSTETDLENGENESESDIVDGFSVENSYMDEKSDALDALGDLAKYSPKSFEPHIDECFQEVFKMQDFPHPDIRKAAIAACGQFLISSHKLEHNLDNDLRISFFPAVSKMICEDSERLVVMTAIMTSKEVLSDCGVKSFANEEKDLQSLMDAILRVLQQKSACQDDEADDEDEQQAEYDEMLIEYCGDVFPLLAGQLKEAFMPYFMRCLPTFVSKLKPTCTTSEKSYGAGTIAETVEKFGTCCPSELLKSVVPRFVHLSRDAETEVRNNSIYGLGVLMQCGGESSANHYPLVLGCLSQALSREKSRKVLDNILSAVCRMIIAHKQLVVLQQVLPVLLANLPLQEDHDEDLTVYGCLATLLRDPEVLNDVAFFTKILDIFAKVLVDEEVSQVVRASIEDEVRGFGTRSQHLLSQAYASNVFSSESRVIIERISTL